ncbi:MAG: biotin-dependent carboxyltransferase family protein [Saprospiraceae bacterium]|jgi:antagonist of KipI|nr:biotin-dependent carboxyltransferase family protein [Saprospiraceae bacterium]
MLFEKGTGIGKNVMNNLLKLHFEKVGLQTSVQDFGRIGHQASGVPVGGAMDQKSMKRANLLVGNPLDTPVLEITLLGPRIRMEGSGVIAIAGADLSAQINGKRLLLNQLIKVEDGDILKFGRPKRGCRAYLAVGGEWLLPEWLGSRSAAFYLPDATPESIPTKGSTIGIRAWEGHQLSEISWLDGEEVPEYSIRVLPGPEFDTFSRVEVAHFFSQQYEVSNDSNRMGYRLEADVKIEGKRKELISSAVVPGTIQITSAGNPIILMRDAQTTGGYHRILNVIEEDLNKIAQMKAREKLRFSICKSSNPFKLLT